MSGMTEQEKNKGGRPPDIGVARSKSVQLRLSQSEYWALREASELDGMSVSAFVRAAAAKAAEKTLTKRKAKSRR